MLVDLGCVLSAIDAEPLPFDGDLDPSLFDQVSASPDYAAELVNTLVYMALRNVRERITGPCDPLAVADE